MPRGLKKLTHAASTQAAWRDWETIEAWAYAHGRSEVAADLAPQPGDGHKTVDRQIGKLRVALGAPAGTWENVLDGLTRAQREQQQSQESAPQMPPAEPRPSRPAEGQSYTQRVYQAYRALAEEMRAPDLEMQAFLRAECLAHRATPSTGEPAFAGDAARQSALCLPGEIDRATGKPQSFLLIKLRLTHQP